MGRNASDTGGYVLCRADTNRFDLPLAGSRSVAVAATKPEVQFLGDTRRPATAGKLFATILTEVV